MPVVFGPAPLDSLDRQILEIICRHGRDGQSFNKLVAEVSGVASRSTFALRTKRLEQLGYLESHDDLRNKQMKKIRGKPMTLVVMRIASMMRSQCADLEQAIQTRANSIAGKRVLSKNELDEEKAFISRANDKIKGIFSLIGVYAVNLGEAVAGDFLLPMVIADFKKLNSSLGSLLISNAQLARVIADEKLAAMPLEPMKDVFKYAFGTDMKEALPKFSKHVDELARRDETSRTSR
jgi:DNA-binding Lrp family transcriptional regulator